MGKGKNDTTIQFMSEEEFDLDESVNLQLDSLERVKKAIANFTKPTENTRKTKRIYYEKKEKWLAETVADFERIHRDIVRNTSRADQVKTEYFTKDFASQFEDAQIDYITLLQTEFEKQFPEAPKTNDPPQQGNNNHLPSGVTLPTVSIPKFSGAYTEWKTFHDLFKSIVHANEKLPGSHKFQYLLGALSGDARDLIADYEVCDDDYPKAWKLLTDTYNDKPTMFVHIMDKFASLEPATNEDPEHLRHIIKETSSCLKSLASVGVSKDEVDPVIAYYLIRKLPVDTLAYWEAIRNRKELPTFESLKSCIETRIRVSSTIANVKTEPRASSSSSSSSERVQNHQSNHSQSKKKKVNTYHSAKSTPSNSTPAASSSNKSSNASKAAGRKYNCPICNNEGHPLRTCDKFLAMAANERRNTIVKLKHCVNCLAFNHTDEKCRSSHTCYTCGERHHSLLHVNDTVHRSSHHTTTAIPSTSATVNACNTQSELVSSSNVLLATAVVSVLDASGKPHALRALIDQGSEANFITESALNALQLPKQAVQAIISGIGASNGHAKHITALTLQSSQNRKFSITVEALVMPRITNLLPSNTFKPQRWEHLIDLTLADPSYHRTGKIDMVLGADVLAQILMEGVRIGPTGTPIAQQTQFGWILSGKISPWSSRNITVTSMHATSKIEELMEKFLTVESVEDASPFSSEEQWCEQFFLDTHRRDETGRFHVRLPFRFLLDPTTPPLGRSRDIAIKRLLQLERRFASNQSLKEEYAKSINEYLETGRMYPTTSTEIEENGHIRSAYLPHHAVFKESSTSTKLRVVFDASRKTSTGKSLNDMLVVGPTIQNDIVTIITNWRFHRIGCTADVQKMYLQVKVDEKDIQYQRIVWRNDPSEPIKDFALNRLTFGTSSAPYMAIRTMNQLADIEKAKYPEAAVAILNDAYVDEVISGGDDVPTVQKLQRDLSEMMKLGGFDLKKWASNENKVLEQIPESDREIKVPVELNANDNIKALGIAWNTATDSFRFKSSLDPIATEKFTKRTALSTQAKLFDPVGLIAPIVVIAKILMKKIWTSDLSLGWDDVLPANLQTEWIRYIEELQHVSEIKIPRWINTSKKCKSFQFHGFCDASGVAYGAALYLRIIDEDDQVHVHLIASKSKVSPAKSLTIPRLELCGAHLLAKLLTFIRKGLRHVTVPAEDVHLWCDSEIVCYWLRSKKQLKVFVENRVSKIHEATRDMHWRHVRTHENPADLVSRGATPRELAENQLWWHGPSWLQLPRSEWPLNQIDVEHPPKDIDPELRRTVQANVCVADNHIVHRFSTYSRLIRLSALCKRYVHNVRNPSNRITGHITVEELQSIKRYWIIQAQQQYYNDELHCLRKTIPEPIDPKSKLISLTPFVDGNGILRVGGRLENSTLSYDEKHPIILPPDAHFTGLVIDRFHERTMHGGTQLMSSLIRRQFWIVNARNTIRFRIHKCVKCLRHRAETTKQLMGSLPSARVRRTIRPFLHTGVDYCGPFDLRASKGRGIKSYKGYIAVFVCLTVKAIHIECVDGLTSVAFLAAFRRFVARRGLPSDMYSDNGTNFVGAANIMEREFQEMTYAAEQNIASKYAEECVQWHFIPPGSPHFGGIWEAGVKSVKHHLRRVIGESKLTFEEIHTLLCQVEACLNSRPLCAHTADSTDLTALTPGHFLVNTDLLSIPEPTLLDIPSNRLDHWAQIQQMRQEFWKRWSNDYLSQLQQRPKWCEEKSNLKINELVLVKDDRLPSSKWPLGRIIEIHPGSDGKVRVVTVRTSTGTYKRNFSRISRLLIQHEVDDDVAAPVTNEEEENQKSA